MCQFKSAILMPNGDLLHNPWTDSHEDLVKLYKLNDTPAIQGKPRFARVEFHPEKIEDLATIDAYRLIIDELNEPDWLTDKLKKRATDKLRLIVSAMIISGDADLLCGGAYILAKGARVSTIKNALIHVMLPESNVGVMRESSNVGVMQGSSNVGVMRESSNVGEMWGSSNVGEMWGSSNVGEMWESSKVGVMWESSNVGVMQGSSNVGEMWESSKVGMMRESSNVGEMWGSSKVGEMWESSKVGMMRESSNVPAGREPKQ